MDDKKLLEKYLSKHCFNDKVTTRTKMLGKIMVKNGNVFGKVIASYYDPGGSGYIVRILNTDKIRKFDRRYPIV